MPTLEIINNGKVAVMYVTTEMIEGVNGDKDLVDGFVNYARAIKGVEVGILLRENSPASVKVSLRSKGRVDVSEVAASFGGGGHANASGFTIDGELQEVREKLFKAIEEKLN